MGIERLKSLILSLLFPIAPPLRLQTAAPPGAPYIDVAHAPPPLFDDPVWHGASDPFVIWNPLKA